MPTTELLVTEVIDDPKRLSRPVLPETDHRPTAGKRVSAHTPKTRWWLAVSLVVLIGLAAAPATRPMDNRSIKPGAVGVTDRRATT